jgi:hypothetical protein
MLFSLSVANPHFQQNQPDLLCLVNRKKGTVAEREMGALDVSSVLHEIAAIKRHQMTISADLKTIQKENQVLWNDAMTIREKYQRQQDTINNILKFLASVFGSGRDPAGAAGSKGKVPLSSPNPATTTKKRKLLIEDGNVNNGITDIPDFTNLSQIPFLAPDLGLGVDNLSGTAHTLNQDGIFLFPIHSSFILSNLSFPVQGCITLIVFSSCSRQLPSIPRI